MTRRLSAALFFFFTFILSSNATASVQTSPPNSVIDLSGEWDFRFDANSLGERQQWHKNTDARGWQKIPVPASYNVVFPDRLWYQGKAWYRRQFETPAQWRSQRVFVKFLGVALRSKIWVNGDYIGEHLFPYTGFEFDITDSLKPDGANHLVVMADNSILERAIPDKLWDGWWNYGGINREVFLESRPVLHIDGLRVDTSMSEASDWNLNLELDIRNTVKSQKTRLEVSVEDLNGKQLWRNGGNRAFPEGASKTALQTRLSGMKAWSPESPNLYVLRVALGEKERRHEITLKFGFRQVEVSGTKVLLNGEPLLIRGIARHEMLPGYGFTVPLERTRQDLEDIKELGSNFLRLAHYPQHPSVYEMCDEVGILIWDEIPAWKTDAATLGDETVWQTYGAPQLEEMIGLHRNHPSVIIWSVGNEFPSDTVAGNSYIRKAAAFVKALDPSRLVTFASNGWENDTTGELLDIVSVNEYYGWYKGSIYDVGPALDAMHRKWPDKPILVSEFGAGCVKGWRNPNPPDQGWDYSEDYHMKFLSAHLRQIYDPSRSDWIVGGVVWSYNDFHDPHRIGRWQHPTIQDYICNKGLVTQDRQRKMAFDTVREFYRKLVQPW